MTRFIIPKEWLKSIINGEDKIDKNLKSIKNSIFVNPQKNKLKNNLDMEKIVIIVYEIMEKILSLEYDIDLLILIDYDSKNKSFDFNEIDIINPSQFNQIDPIYEQTAIDKGYYEPKKIKTKKINLGESTNELLNAKEEDKEEPKIRRIKSGKIKKININEGNAENIKLRGKRNNSKKNVNKNVINNNEDENEENLDELNTNEKMHSTSYNFQNEKRKEINNDIIIINKNSGNIKNIKEQKDIIHINEINEIQNEEHNNENEELKEYKIYFYNENQKIINLSIYKGESIKPLGLINPSIYCFMICILQSLICIPELNYFFLSKIYLLSSFYNNNIDSNINENNIEEKYPICNSYQYFIKIYLLSKKSYIQIPRNLFRICNKLLGGMHMHDSQEFFVCFLEALQDELNSSNKNKKEQKTGKKEIPKTMEEKWNEYRIRNNSFIDSLFTGLMRSTVECKNCKHRSITYDPFIDLNVSLNKYKNLEKCLKQYFENEKIDCEYKCDNCKQVSKVSIY